VRIIGHVVHEHHGLDECLDFIGCSPLDIPIPSTCNICRTAIVYMGISPGAYCIP
jgi:hypothetical protein